MLLAGPGVLATLTFAPMVITLFYSADFDAAADVLRWICFGAMLQVISWPMGFIIVAKGAQRIFFLAELAWAAVNIGFAWICINSFGLSRRQASHSLRRTFFTASDLSDRPATQRFSLVSREQPKSALSSSP